MSLPIPGAVERTFLKFLDRLLGRRSVQGVIFVLALVGFWLCSTGVAEAEEALSRLSG
jgi:hypothetical protein